MNSKLKTLILAAAAMVVTTSSARAGDVDVAGVLRGGPSCGHVIHLLLRYGASHDANPIAGSLITATHAGPLLVPAAELGDLELLGVSQLEVGDPACGPRFAVTVRNNSNRDVCGFRITLVGLLGRIHPHAPTAIVKVDKVCAGEAVEVQVDLPVEALAMGNRNGQVIGFQKLVVAIDSFDQFVEANEANNVKILACTEIPLVKVSGPVAEPSTGPEPVTETSMSPASVTTEMQPATASVTTPVADPPGDGPDGDLQTAIHQLSQQQQPETSQDNSDPQL